MSDTSANNVEIEIKLRLGSFMDYLKPFRSVVCPAR